VVWILRYKDKRGRNRYKVRQDCPKKPKPKPKDFKCKVPQRRVSKGTLEKESCEKLLARLDCYRESSEACANEESHLTEIFQRQQRGKATKDRELTLTKFKQKEARLDDRFRATTENYVTTGLALHEKQCPPIPVSEMHRRIQREFPNHRFRTWRNTIQIPKNFTRRELRRLETKIPKMSCHNYKVRRKRDRVYVGPVQLQEEGAHLQECF
jgi:hypothetical protein